MANTVKADNYNISMRTNDNYILTVELAYDISTAIPTMNLKKAGQNKKIEMTAYITKNQNNTGFVINIPSFEIATMNIGTYAYDCVLDFGSGSKIFLFGGSVTITAGIS